VKQAFVNWFGVISGAVSLLANFVYFASLFSRPLSQPLSSPIIVIALFAVVSYGLVILNVVINRAIGHGERHYREDDRAKASIAFSLLVGIPSWMAYFTTLARYLQTQDSNALRRVFVWWVGTIATSRDFDPTIEWFLYSLFASFLLSILLGYAASVFYNAFAEYR
jgi:hypothetical protein